MSRSLIDFILEIIQLIKIDGWGWEYITRQGINFDEYSDTGTHWITLCALNNNVAYFDSFGVEHIPEENIKCIDRFLITTNFYKIQESDSVMCGYSCI